MDKLTKADLQVGSDIRQYARVLLLDMESGPLYPVRSTEQSMISICGPQGQSICLGYAFDDGVHGPAWFGSESWCKVKDAVVNALENHPQYYDHDSGNWLQSVSETEECCWCEGTGMITPDEEEEETECPYCEGGICGVSYEVSSMIQSFDTHGLAKLLLGECADVVSR